MTSPTPVCPLQVPSAVATRTTVSSPKPPLALDSASVVTDSDDGVLNSNASTSAYELDVTLGCPHVPPYNITNSLVDANVGSVRSRVIQEQAARMYPAFDRLQDVMEDRIVRWRPPQSQHGTDSVIQGNHIYQQQPESEVNGAWDWLCLWTWFGKLALSHGCENLPQDRLQPTHTTELPDLELQPLDLAQFKPNSSRSFLDGGISRPSVVNHGVPLSPMTPKAVLWTDFELHYDKQEDPNYVVQHDTHELISSMDQDVQNLVDGVDNFITGCFSSITNNTLLCCTEN